MRYLDFRIAVLSVGCLLCAPISAQVTERVSVDSSGIQGNYDSYYPLMSADARYVAFTSGASNLVPGDTNGTLDAFVRDRTSGTTERVSVDSNGVQGNNGSFAASISADGRYVAFASLASNLVPGDTNGTWDVFVRDRLAGTTERVSVDSSGAQGNQDSSYPSISADGRYVAFLSIAFNLVPGDTNGCQDVFVRDRQSGTTERASVDSGGAQANSQSGDYNVFISADGRYVMFDSYASNLVAEDTNGREDVFLRDRQSGTTERASVDSGGAQADGDSSYPSISADGRYVAFYSIATDLVPGDTNRAGDVFVHDRQSGATERVSLASGGDQADGFSGGYSAIISPDGRYVAFDSSATNLVPNDTNGTQDVFVRDRQNGTTERVNVDSSGAQGNARTYTPSISAGGRYVAFWGYASNLVPGDTNGYGDVFLRDRDATSFTSTCDPGASSVIACPCSNDASGPDRGCDNSAATGGARLSAVGIAYLSMDSLVFTTSGENPTSLSIVMQGNSAISTGAVYGQGVRCLGGPLIRRLFIKHAAAGSITAPEFASGDPTVSSRSAAKGDLIQPGESRWYLVYYRDPVVLGGCPASSTFNATQTGRVDWSF